MTRVVVDIRKSVEENATWYFERAKKAKRKLAGVEETVRRFRAELARLEQDKERALVEEIKKQQKVARQKAWYEKFRWFFSSEGFLCIGGRDATTNEVIIKKHTDKNDIVFHTEMSGSPFFVIKAEGKKTGEITMQEVAQAVAMYSRAWKSGVSVADVYWINPEQVSKKTKAGEFMGRGAFMIYGKRNYVRTSFNAAIGLLPDGRVMAGPQTAVQKNCGLVLSVLQGDEKTSACAKKVAKLLKVDDLDAIIAVLPVGGVKLVR